MTLPPPHRRTKRRAISKMSKSAAGSESSKPRAGVESPVEEGPTVHTDVIVGIWRVRLPRTSQRSRFLLAMNASVIDMKSSKSIPQSWRVMIYWPHPCYRPLWSKPISKSKDLADTDPNAESVTSDREWAIPWSELEAASWPWRRHKPLTNAFRMIGKATGKSNFDADRQAFARLKHFLTSSMRLPTTRKPVTNPRREVLLSVVFWVNRSYLVTTITYLTGWTCLAVASIGWQGIRDIKD